MSSCCHFSHALVGTAQRRLLLVLLLLVSVLMEHAAAVGFRVSDCMAACPTIDKDPTELHWEPFQIY